MFSLNFKINVWYILFNDGEGDYFNNEQLSTILNIDEKTYRNRMLDFGALEFDRILYFLDEELGKNALEWIESVYILRKLESD